MKHLKLETVLDKLEHHENVTCYQSLRNVIELMILDLLETDPLDYESGFNTKEEDFYESSKEELPEKENNLPLTNDSCIKIRYVAKCEFEYNEMDESNVGLGLKGDISGIETSWFEIMDLSLYMADGSVIDLNYSLKIKNYLHNNINI